MLIVRPATAPEMHARNLLTARVWGNRLTETQYLAREAALLATEFARRGMRTWVLEDDALPGTLLASCESHAMISVFDGASGTSQGIASVFVEERLRGRGLAATMLGLLQDRFRAESAHASILFSEVGATIYERAGYVARPIRARVWTPAPGDVSAIARPLARGDLAGVEWPVPVLPRVPRFAIRPDHAQLEWHRERSSFYRRILAPERMDPDLLCGAEIDWLRILWTPDYRNDVLMVLLAGDATTGSRTREKEILVEALRRAAHALGMPRAELWESPAITLPGGESIRRDDELPMIAPYAPGLVPTDWVDYGRGCWV